MQHRKTNFREKNSDNDMKKPSTIGLVIANVLNTKINEIENKILDTSILVTTTVLNTKIEDVENKILIMLNILVLRNLVT